MGRPGNKSIHMWEPISPTCISDEKEPDGRHWHDVDERRDMCPKWVVSSQ